MKEASFPSLFFSLPRSAVQCEVRASSVPPLCPAFINQGFVRRSQEVVKLCQNQVQRQLNKKAPIPNFAGVSLLTQSKCCRLEGRISLCKVTCPISTDGFMLIGGPAIISPFIPLTDKSEQQRLMLLSLLLISILASDKSQTLRIPSQ